jgi:hypothetical protein
MDEQNKCSIIPFGRGQAFDEQTTKIVGDAFDKTLIELHDSGQPELVREIIARLILNEASRGERDPERLCALALVSLGIGQN